jgi:hypothetical protein
VSRRPPPRKTASRRPAAKNRAPRRRPTGLYLVLGVIVVVGVAAVAAFAAGGGSDAKKAKGANGQVLLDYGKVTASGSPLQPFASSNPAAGDGDPIPTITGESPDRTPATVSPSVGKQVVIVGAPRCPHCNNELPPLARALASGSLGDIKATLIVTSQQPNAPHWPPGDWINTTLHWPAAKAPVILDDKNGTAASALNTGAFPYFVFVDSNGKVGSRATGEIGLDAFRQKYAALR